jgi:hypothetical protein
MDACELSDIRDIHGMMSQQRIKDFKAFERAYYVEILQRARIPAY